MGILSKKELIDVINNLEFEEFDVQFALNPEEPKFKPLTIHYETAVALTKPTKENLELRITSQRILIPVRANGHKWNVVKSRDDIKL